MITNLWIWISTFNIKVSIKSKNFWVEVRQYGVQLFRPCRQKILNHFFFQKNTQVFVFFRFYMYMFCRTRKFLFMFVSLLWFLLFGYGLVCLWWCDESTDRVGWTMRISCFTGEIIFWTYSYQLESKLSNYLSEKKLPRFKRHLKMFLMNSKSFST